MRLAVPGRPKGTLALVKTLEPEIDIRVGPGPSGSLKPFRRPLEGRGRKDTLGKARAAPRKQETFTLVGETPGEGLPV